MQTNPDTVQGKIVVRGCVEIWQRDGVIHVLYRSHAEIDAEIKHEMHLVFLEITGGKKHPFMFLSEGALWYTREGREYARRIEPKQPFLAVAVVSPSLGYRLLADFYAKLYKPEVPYKVFKEEEEAKVWLKTFGT